MYIVCGSVGVIQAAIKEGNHECSDTKPQLKSTRQPHYNFQSTTQGFPESSCSGSFTYIPIYCHWNFKYFQSNRIQTQYKISFQPYLKFQTNEKGKYFTSVKYHKFTSYGRKKNPLTHIKWFQQNISLSRAGCVFSKSFPRNTNPTSIMPSSDPAFVARY